MLDSNDNDEVSPPYSLRLELAHLQGKIATDTWGAPETQWLNDNLRLFDTGIYRFEPSAWYPLACQLVATQQRSDVWLACCKDMQFSYGDAFHVPFQSSDAREVRELVCNWFYVHLNKDVFPSWDPTTQTLHAVHRPHRTKAEHVWAVLNAFASPQLVTEVHRGIAVSQGLGIKGHSEKLDGSIDTWRYTSWLLSPDIGGRRLPSDRLDMPTLDNADFPSF